MATFLNRKTQKFLKSLESDRREWRRNWDGKGALRSCGDLEKSGRGGMLKKFVGVDRFVRE